MDNSQRADILICVTGLPAAGKTVFVRQLRYATDRRVALAKELGIEADTLWHFIPDRKILTTRPLPRGVIVTYFDLMHQMDRGSEAYDGIPSLTGLDAAQRRIVITAWADPRSLKRRLFKRLLIKWYTRFVRYDLARFKAWWRRQSRYHALYGDAEWVIAQYRRWFAFVDSRPNYEQWVLDCRREPAGLYQIDAWRALASSERLPV